jgi:2-(1,2-epoxy-1,2-dihydrophenyl)acetyl-CoA isomerase
VAVEMSQHDGVAVVELNRPAQMNALTVEDVVQLGRKSAQAVDGGARALLITGRGSSFCAGADLSLVREALAGEPHRVLTPLVTGLHASIRQIRELKVPIVAAVEGAAVGAGLGIALATDVRVLGQGARLIPGYLAIGSSPDSGASYFLTRALGPARAMSLLLSNRPVDADEALALGLAYCVVAAGKARDAGLELARTLTGTAPLALVRARELVDVATTHGLADHLDLERERVTELWDTRDFREGVTAFLERRSPVFRGELAEISGN